MSEEALLRQAAYAAERIAELNAHQKLHAKQLEVVQAIFGPRQCKRVFIRKGRKAGGTELLEYVANRVVGTRPNRAAYIIGPTKESEKEIIWANRRLLNSCPRAWKPVPNEQEKRIRLANDSFIKVEGADDPEAARGWEGDFFGWDERKDHNQLSLDNCYPNIASRDGIWMELGTPPTTKTNSYYIKEQEILKDPDWLFFKFTAWDNPFLPGGHEWLQKERDKYYARGEGDLWEIEWEGNYVFNARRKVLPNFRDEIHIYPSDVIEAELSRDKQNLKWIAVFDPGYATCFAAIFAAYNPYTAQIYIVDEIYSTDKSKNSVHEIWPKVESIQKHHYDGRWENIYDSAALGFAVEVDAWCRAKYRYSVGMIPTVKARNDEDDYFRAINASFSQPGQVKIARKCRGLISEIENYETDEHDRYPDENNHSLDSMRYLYKFLGFTVEGIQSKITVVPVLPRGYTPEQDRINESNKFDMVGFGGLQANFDPMKVWH